MEGVVHEGWLVKSPPEKRLLKAKWRQRWFVLRHSGLLPGQYILEYFTDNSCKKLKGKIDLDHCDQVDVGSTCETKKTSYQYMFDIITPKRTYYLVAETEAEMNKWVDCICTVGGLKLYVDEGSDINVEAKLVTNPLSMISKGLLSSTTLLSAIAVTNNYLMPQDSSSSSAMASAAVATNLIETKSTSNPYIPISECHTGKPVLNGDLPKHGRLSDLPREAPPPPPSASVEQNFAERPSSMEFYDIPRPIKPVGIHMSGSARFGTVHKGSNLSSSSGDNFYNGCKTLPPRVNWNTHPGDVHSTNGGTPSRRDSNDAAAYDIVPPLHSVSKPESHHRELQGLTVEFEKASVAASVESLSLGGSASSLPKAPPRPPKPSKLRDRHDYENFELINLGGKTEDPGLYDIPPPVKAVTFDSSPAPRALSDSKKDHVDATASTAKPPLSSSVGNEAFIDDTYDFPKFRSEDNIATVPPPPSSYATSTSQRSRRHIYTNAPPGLFNSKELIFNYEYRPSLMSDYVNMDAGKQDIYTSGNSPGNSSTCPKGPYANIPNTSPSIASGSASDTPPAVNRDLKPKGSVEDGSINFLTLQPPPLYKMRANKCSFRRHGEMYKGTGAPSPMPGLNGTPPVPNRFRHHADLCGPSEDDVSSFTGSRRGSTNDEQTRHYFTGTSGKKDEIQYLDLDLDSEPSPSPKTPERVSATVYKKVDFVKTKAFNEMRQNVEETYRKSQ